MTRQLIKMSDWTLNEFTFMFINVVLLVRQASYWTACPHKSKIFQLIWLFVASRILVPTHIIHICISNWLEQIIFSFWIMCSYSVVCLVYQIYFPQRRKNDIPLCLDVKQQPKNMDQAILPAKWPAWR